MNSITLSQSLSTKMIQKKRESTPVGAVRSSTLIGADFMPTNTTTKLDINFLQKLQASIFKVLLLVHKLGHFQKCHSRPIPNLCISQFVQKFFSALRPKYAFSQFVQELIECSGGGKRNELKEKIYL